MAFPTPVNGQITDAAAPPNAGSWDSPLAQNLLTVYQAAAVSLVSALYSESPMAGMCTTVAAQGVAAIYSIDSATMGEQLSKNLSSTMPQASAALAKLDAGSISQVLTEGDDEQIWNNRIRELMLTVRTELRELQEFGQAAGLALIKQAALAMALKGMVAAPEQFEQYEKMARFIKEL